MYRQQTLKKYVDVFWARGQHQVTSHQRPVPLGAHESDGFKTFIALHVKLAKWKGPNHPNSSKTIFFLIMFWLSWSSSFLSMLYEDLFKWWMCHSRGKDSRGLHAGQLIFKRAWAVGPVNLPPQVWMKGRHATSALMFWLFVRKWDSLYIIHDTVCSETIQNCCEAPIVYTWKGWWQKKATMMPELWGAGGSWNGKHNDD